MNPQYPLVFSTLLIRLGVGILITYIIMSLASEPVPSAVPLGIFSMCSVLFGVILSMTHLGQPKRFLNAFANLTSMLAWEAILTPLLLISMFLLVVGSYFGDLAVLIGAGKIGGVVFGVLLIYVTAKVYHLKARPSWATSLVVYEFFVSALCMGILGYQGLLPFLATSANSAWAYLVILALSGLIAEFVVTLYYRHYVGTVSATALEVLRDKATVSQYYLWLVLGLALPFVLYCLALITKEAYRPLMVISFLSFFLGAMFWRILFFKIATPLKITPEITNI
jgi:anaerobic dimethyl sulfoxide reductase subunit C (anchor subunit)